MRPMKNTGETAVQKEANEEVDWSQKEANEEGGRRSRIRGEEGGRRGRHMGPMKKGGGNRGSEGGR